MAGRLALSLIVIVASTVSAGSADARLTEKQKLQRSESVIDWYNGQGRWTLRPRVEKCWHLRWSEAEDRCYRHRTNLRWHIARAQELRPPELAVRYLSAWLCIHSHEGAWNANTGNGYFGGLQMDWSFMRAYGGDLLEAKGTADNWTPLEQMAVAERAHRSRGFYPWPNTARMCGLI